MLTFFFFFLFYKEHFIRILCFVLFSCIISFFKHFVSENPGIVVSSHISANLVSLRGVGGGFPIIKRKAFLQFHNEIKLLIDRQHLSDLLW